MIFCGFPGVGKTVNSRRSRDWIDLDSTLFNKDFKAYAKVAKALSEAGFYVQVSTHKELRDELEALHQEYYVVIPSKLDKQNYLSRYSCRGDSKEFVSTLDANFETWIDDILETHSRYQTVIVLRRMGTMYDIFLIFDKNEVKQEE